MKRLNPDTGRPFERGETRALDNRTFNSYNKEKIRETGENKGTFWETWVSPETKKNLKVSNQKSYEDSYNPSKKGKRKINPETNKPYKRHETREDGFIFIEYNLSRVDKKGFYKTRFSSPESFLRKNIRTNIRRKVRDGKEVAKNVTVDYLLEIFPKDHKCPVFGTKMAFGGNKKTSPSMDRINPEEGYIRGNIAWISDLANTIKTDASPEQIFEVAKWLEKISR
jgi:hypothetical protein